MFRKKKDKAQNTQSAEQQLKSSRVKSPRQVYLEERKKTAQAKLAQKLANENAQNVVRQKQTELTVALDSLKVKLDEDIAKKCKLELEDVNKLSKSVKDSREIIAALEEKLAKERKSLATNVKSLYRAEKKLAKSSRPLSKQYHQDYKKTEKSGLVELKKAQRQEKQIKKEMRKNLRKEKITTVKNTLKASLSYSFALAAAIPDVTIKLIRSMVGAVKELSFTFNRVAKRASQEYKKPTRFTKMRR